MIIYNAHILTMTDLNSFNKNKSSLGWIEFNQGKIVKVCCDGSPENISPDDFNACGGFVYPGFIDAHTHLGIIGDGLGFESDDCNEQSDPFTPQLRTIDAINPFDRCFEEARMRGITRCAVAPGSANVCGGQISFVRTFGRRIDNMAQTIAIKFALGENPKTTYNDRDETPVTRMAAASIIREGLFKASRYLSDINKHNSDPDNYELPDFDMKCNALIPLLNREIKAHFHCHRADDILTAVRISKEFNLDCVIVHGTEGHLIADILGEENVPVISGPVISERCKPELKNHSADTAAVLRKNGVKTAVCTDHPVIPIQFLPLSADITRKYGISEFDALRSVTADAAEILGVSNLFGTIETGKTADLQVYNSPPLDVISEPYAVFADGIRVK